MPNPIRIRINKGTIVPTKKQKKHEERTDWKTVGVIDYSESPGIFSYLGNGLIRTDAQFARILFENFGSGIFTCIYWRKGMKGFRRFIMLERTCEGFNQMKAKVYRNKRKQDLEAEYARAKFDYQEMKSESNWDEMQNLQKKIDRAYHAQGPYPYLESLQQRYKFHNYEGFQSTEDEPEESDNKEVVQDTGFWSTPIEPDYIEQEPEDENKTEMGFW